MRKAGLDEPALLVQEEYASEPAVDRAGDVELALVHHRAQQPAAILLNQPARLLDQRGTGALRLDDEYDAGRPRRQGRAAEIREHRRGIDDDQLGMTYRHGVDAVERREVEQQAGIGSP